MERSITVRCPGCGTQRTLCVAGRPDLRAAERNADGREVPGRCRSCQNRERLKLHPRRLSPYAHQRLADRAWLMAEYAKSSMPEIGRQLGCSHQTVSEALRRHDIPRRSTSEAARLKVVTPGQRPGRNRQMVTGDGLSDALPGTVKHFGIAA